MKKECFAPRTLSSASFKRRFRKKRRVAPWAPQDAGGDSQLCRWAAQLLSMASFPRIGFQYLHKQAIIKARLLSNMLLNMAQIAEMEQRLAKCTISQKAWLYIHYFILHAFSSSFISCVDCFVCSIGFVKAFHRCPDLRLVYFHICYNLTSHKAENVYLGLEDSSWWPGKNTDYT